MQNTLDCSIHMNRTTYWYVRETAICNLRRNKRDFYTRSSSRWRRGRYFICFVNDDGVQRKLLGIWWKHTTVPLVQKRYCATELVKQDISEGSSMNTRIQVVCPVYARVQYWQNSDFAMHKEVLWAGERLHRDHCKEIVSYSRILFLLWEIYTCVEMTMVFQKASKWFEQATGRWWRCIEEGVQYLKYS